MNYGQPIHTATVVNLPQAINLFNEIRKSGQVFRVDFVKRTTGNDRTMICRTGVKKYLSGANRLHKPIAFLEKGLLPVYEMGNGYRSIPIESIKAIKFRGTWYSFGALNGMKSAHKMGETWSPSGFNKSYRTVFALTSPLHSS